MELQDTVTLEEYEALPATFQIYYERNEDTGTAAVDLSLNNVLKRGGYSGTQNKLRNELTELRANLDKYRGLAETPEQLTDRLKTLEALEAAQANGGEDINKKIEEIRLTSDKRLNEELEKQGSTYKQKIAELEAENKAHQNQLTQIRLWDELTSLAPDLKPKYHEIFKASHLGLFTLDENGKIKLSGTDPESLINTPAKKIESIRKEYPELFLGQKEMELSPYNLQGQGNRGSTSNADADYQKALQTGNVDAMLAAQGRMQ